MLKLQLSDIATEVGSKVGVGEKNTVSSGPDNGFNNFLAARFWNCARHATTQQAIDFSLSFVALSSIHDGPGSLSAGGLNLGGHGNEGYLETGQGQSGPYNPGTSIHNYNQGAWGPQLDKLKPSPITMLSIWSCHTGAGQDGADLLYAMAVRCGRAVRARTGFTYTNSTSVWFENNSTWQVATPSHKPAPIAAPTPHFVGTMVVFETAGANLSAEDVVGVTIERMTAPDAKTTPKSLTDAAAAQLVKDLFVPNAMDMDVAIMGFITATIAVTFKGGATLVFDVYNDRLAVEQSAKTGYYLRGPLKTLYDLL